MNQEITDVNAWLNLFTIENVGNMLALLFIASLIIGFIHSVTSPKNSHSLLDMFLPLGSSKMRINGTWIVAMFILVYQTIGNTVTQGVIGLIMAAFVTDRIFGRKDGKKEPPKKLEEGEKE